MKKSFNLVFVLALLVIFLGTILSACSTSTSSTPPSGVVTSAPLDGQALMQERCTVCHSTDRIVQKHATLEQWTITVDRMIGKGAGLDSAEKQTLLEYLAQTYP